MSAALTEVATVLVVDDTATNLQVLESILVQGGYRVRSAISGPAALKSAFAQPPDLVLLDMRLPTIGGAEVCRSLKNNEHTRNVPVIFISAIDSLADKIEAFKEGGVDYINWPFQVEEVLARVATHLSIARSQAVLTRKNAELEQANTDLRNADEQVRELNVQLLAREQELQAVNLELETFSYSVAHDLRSPLRTIDGFTHVLLDDHADVLNHNLLGVARRIGVETARMAALIDDLLRLAHIRSAPLQRETVDLSSMALEILQSLQELEPNRRVEITVAPHMTAYSDPGLTLCVLRNILGNAWKFTSQKPQAAIHFAAEYIGGKNTFVVRDNGAGFDRADCDKMFKPFQRLETAREYEGSGIGLAIVARIIKRHEATVWADGEPGKGATFYFTI